MGEADKGRKRLAIGIDPPKGLAAYNRDTRKFERLMSVTFWDIIETLDMVREHYDITVVCEAPQKNPPVWLGKTRHGNRAFASNAALMKAAQNVGQNKQCAILIIEWCERNKVKVITQKPSGKSMTKLTHEDFCFRTGWSVDKQTNEHTRDAAMLVWGL